MKNIYCLGFLFDRPGQRATKVALIRKQRPDWQRGLLNGIGGKVEDREGSAQAMSREFEEETSVQIPWHEWNHYATMLGRHFIVHVFRAFNPEAFVHVRTMTDEEVIVLDMTKWEQHPAISNIPWLLALALDPGTEGPEYAPVHAEIIYP